MLRQVIHHFEHRLFLSATPHNGHSNSFSALLEILDPQRFTRAAQIWGFAGFDPLIGSASLGTQQSGDFRRVGHISKKGDPGLRDTLYLIGLSPGTLEGHTARSIPAIDRVKQRAKARGMGDVGATLHAAHKANRICHHLLYYQVPFDPDRVR